MSKPLIGLVGRRRKGGRIGGLPPVFAEVDVDMYISDYARAVSAAGGVPFWLPLDADPFDVVAKLDGLLLTGGEDIAPSLYADRLGPSNDGTPRANGSLADTGATNADDAFDTPDDPVTTGGGLPLRDAFELAVLNAAIERRLPTLGICRGIQLLNVAAGGTLHSHLPAHKFIDGPPDATPHRVTTVAGSQLRHLYGPELTVNSLHHQAPDLIGDGYTATAQAPDGIVEGMEHTELPIIAVQWHPELMNGALTDPCFGWLTGEAADLAARSSSN